MPFAYLLKTGEDVESFRVRYNIHRDIEISYYHEGDIEDQRLPHVMFFPLMSILEGEVRFPVDPLLLRTHNFYSRSPYQCLPNFYSVVSYVGRLNRLNGLSLTHNDINFLYAIRGSLKLGYYLQTRNTMVRLISYLPDSNRNSAREYVKVSNNWLNGELTSTSSRQIGQYFLFLIPKHSQIVPPFLFFVLLVCLLSFTYHLFHVRISFLFFYYFLGIPLTRIPSPTTISKKFWPDINIMHVWELNFILRSEVFVHYDE